MWAGPRAAAHTASPALRLTAPLSAPQTEPLTSKALTFLSVAGERGVQEKSVDTDVVAAEVSPQVLSNLQALLANLFIPLVANQPPGRRQAESAKEEFIKVGAGARVGQAG